MSREESNQRFQAMRDATADVAQPVMKPKGKTFGRNPRTVFRPSYSRKWSVSSSAGHFGNWQERNGK